MEKLISPDGVKANMCCASCKYYSLKFKRGHLKKKCLKKDIIIKELSHKCSFYGMTDFFAERGYKPLI